MIETGFFPLAVSLSGWISPSSSNPPEISPISTNPWATHSLEVHNVPKRSNTHPGHVFSRKPENMTIRTRNRITRKLADVNPLLFSSAFLVTNVLLQMGFTENSHPQLPQRISSHVPDDGFISKDQEDDIVTTLLEELIPLPPKPSVPGSSRNDGPPGAWK